MFVLVAAVAAGSLALGAFISARSYREGAFLDRAARQTELNVAMAAGRIDELDALLDLYERRGRFETVVVDDRRVVASSQPALEAAATSLPEGETGPRQTEVDGSPYLVMGGRPPDSGLSLYFFYSQSGLRASLAQLRQSLAVGWLLVTGLAAVAGSIVARRTLAPVARASLAARRLTEGLLDTRLPDGADDEFGEWARYFNQMAAALGEKLTALAEAGERHRRFTADVTHELRTPLGSMVATAALIEDKLDLLPPEARRPAELLVSEVAALRTLVLDLLELARLDAGDMDVHPEELSLARAAAAVVATASRQPAPVLDLRDTVVVADRRRLERVVSNLIDNAYRHGSPPILVRTTEEDGVGVLEVEDHGPGIPRAERERVFGRFYKGDPSRASGGTGLGLAIARENAEAMGARLTVDSTMGRPTSFRLELPLAADDAPRSVTRVLPQGPARVTGQG